MHGEIVGTAEYSENKTRMKVVDIEIKSKLDYERPLILQRQELMRKILIRIQETMTEKQGTSYKIFHQNNKFYFGKL